MHMLNKIKIIIIFGGDSSEREVSLISGSEINNALSKKYETELIEINPINYDRDQTESVSVNCSLRL